MSRSQQQGSLFVVVIFVLVVMGFLATTLSQIRGSNNDSHLKDVLGTQAALLAHSGNEYMLERIYGINGSGSIAALCTNTQNIKVIRPNDPHLQGTTVFTTKVNCGDVQLTCRQQGGVLDGKQMYVIRSTAKCGSGINQMQRNQEIWIRE